MDISKLQQIKTKLQEKRNYSNEMTKDIQEKFFDVIPKVRAELFNKIKNIDDDTLQEIIENAVTLEDEVLCLNFELNLPNIYFITDANDFITLYFGITPCIEFKINNQNIFNIKLTNNISYDTKKSSDNISYSTKKSSDNMFDIYNQCIENLLENKKPFKTTYEYEYVSIYKLFEDMENVVENCLLMLTERLQEFDCKIKNTQYNYIDEDSSCCKIKYRVFIQNPLLDE